MYTYMYNYVYVHIYNYMFVHMYICIYVWSYLCKQINTPKRSLSYHPFHLYSFTIYLTALWFNITLVPLHINVNGSNICHMSCKCY